MQCILVHGTEGQGCLIHPLNLTVKRSASSDEKGDSHFVGDCNSALSVTHGRGLGIHWSQSYPKVAVDKLDFVCQNQLYLGPK